MMKILLQLIEKILTICKRIAPRNPYHFVWISCLFSFILSFLFSSVLSTLIYQEIPSSLLLVAGMDGVLIPLIVAPFVIYFMLAEKKRAEKELKALSITDELTGLKNRRGFYAFAKQQLHIANREKDLLHIIYMDLDGFKKINDNFGHNVGDEALVNLAQILNSVYRSSDIIARIGGDEFIVFLVNCDPHYLSTLIIRLHEALEEHNDKGSAQYRLAASIGLASYNPDTPCSLDDLLQTADQKMLENKKSRKQER